MSGPVNSKDVAEQISKLYELHKSGALTESEFENAKQRVLDDRQSPLLRAAHPVSDQFSKAEPRKRSALFQMARGCGIFVLGFVALVVVGVIATAIFGDGGEGDNGNSLVNTEQPSNSDPGPLLTGIVVMMNVANTDDAGAACYGIGNHAVLAEGATVSLTAIGGHQDKEASLSSGTVDQYGHCRMAFGVPWFEVDEYQFGFDNDLFVHCDRDAIVEIGENYTTQVRFAPNGAYCQAPAN